MVKLYHNSSKILRHQVNIFLNECFDIVSLPIDDLIPATKSFLLTLHKKIPLHIEREGTTLNLCTGK